MNWLAETGVSSSGGGTPAQIGDYRIEKELGRGGMGAVFLARHVQIGQRVALKLVLDSNSSPQALGRFEVEARSMAKLSHPGIVRVLGGGLFGMRPYLVMELVEGESLADRLRRVGVLDEAEAAELTERLA